MSGPETPEALARLLRDETAALQADAFLASRAIAVARERSELERPALVVLAFAASLSLWLSLQSEAPASFDNLDDALDAAEASL